ncbi:MAG: hypothetical protein WDM86_11670 [Rhizomicrobium sp.]
MSRPVDVIVTGFTRSAELCVQSFETPRHLRQMGLVRAIRYVTWDSPELDAAVAPVLAMDDVAVTRVPAPAPPGNFKQKGVVYQVRNLEAALALVPEDDTLVVKTRPDFLFGAGFLERKIRDFDRQCRIEASATAFGVKLPRGPFSRKVWLPWADANQPFFYEDAAFAGLKRDLAHLVTPDIQSRLGAMDDLECGSLAHAVRFGTVFLARFPIFRGYFENYHVFANNTDYRRGQLGTVIEHPFFWTLVLAHAWILYSSFHVDAGRPGDLRFFANNANPKVDWSDPDTLTLAAPYDDLAGWRATTKAGTEVYSGVSRVYGRLVDDAWQRALFTQRFADIPWEMLQGIAQTLPHYDKGVLDEMEDEYYALLTAHWRQHWLPRQRRAA